PVVGGELDRHIGTHHPGDDIGQPHGAAPSVDLLAAQRFRTHLAYRSGSRPSRSYSRFIFWYTSPLYSRQNSSAEYNDVEYSDLWPPSSVPLSSISRWWVPSGSRGRSGPVAQKRTLT